MTRLQTEKVVGELCKAEAILNHLRHVMEEQQGIDLDWHAVTAAEDILINARRMFEEEEKERPLFLAVRELIREKLDDISEEHLERLYKLVRFYDGFEAAPEAHDDHL